MGQRRKKSRRRRDSYLLGELPEEPKGIKKGKTTGKGKKEKLFLDKRRKIVGVEKEIHLEKGKKRTDSRI